MSKTTYIAKNPSQDITANNKPVQLKMDSLPVKEPSLDDVDFDSETIRHLAHNLSHLLTWRSNGSYNAAILYEDTLSLVKKLPYDQRRAIFLRYILDHTLQQVAKEMSISYESVRNLCNRGIAAMAADIDSHEEDN
jgi:DNA-directed RNA polymerase specialized sigma24 family protein